MMHGMRTTVTLDPDVADQVARSMREQGASFKEVVNQGLRRGLIPTAGRRFRQRTYDLGAPRFGAGDANHAADDLDDAHILHG